MGKSGYSLADLEDWTTLNLRNKCIQNLDTFYQDLKSILDGRRINGVVMEWIRNSDDPMRFTLVLKDYLDVLRAQFDNTSNKPNINCVKSASFYINDPMVHLDYDQASSGPMLYALLSKDREMLHATNVLNNTNKRQDLYSDFLGYLQKCIDNKLIRKYELQDDLGKLDLYSKISKNLDRSFIKGIVMPTFYNMGAMGINRKFMELFKALNLQDLEEKQESIKLVRDLTKITEYALSKKYSETIAFQAGLVNYCYGFSDFKKAKVKNRIEPYSVTFNTLDGGCIEYDYKTLVRKLRTRRVRNSNGSHLTYNVYLPPSGIKSIDKYEYSYKHYKTFPPNFIQNLDAALCRLIILVLYNVTNKRIILEPLHDSFRIPPTLIDSVKSVIKYVYFKVFFPEYSKKKKLYLVCN